MIFGVKGNLPLEIPEPIGPIGPIGPMALLASLVSFAGGIFSSASLAFASCQVSTVNQNAFMRHSCGIHAT